MTRMPRNAFLFTSVMLAAGSLAACTSLFGSEDIKVRPVENMSGLTSASPDRFYESAVTAINDRDYARALDYLQEARAQNPRNVKALNALGVVYDKLGRFDLSARYYAQARAVEPESRIVAENVGYSRVLQGLLNPGRPVAVATIDLPADLNNASPEQPTMVVSAIPAVVAPTVSPVEKPAVAAIASIVPSLLSVVPPARPATLAPPVVVSAAPAVVASDVSPAKKPAVAALAPAVTSASGVVPPAKLPAAALRAVAATAPAVVTTTKPLAQKRVAAVSDVPGAAASVQHSKVVFAFAANKKVFTIGQPVQILNASGTRDRVGVVSRRLSQLGWTVRQSDARRVQSMTVLSYPAQNAFAAKAMQRTLPFPVRLVSEQRGVSAMRLVIGRDYLSWKPRNTRLAALWQKGTIVASLQKPSLKGAR